MAIRPCIALRSFLTTVIKILADIFFVKKKSEVLENRTIQKNL